MRYARAVFTILIMALAAHAQSGRGTITGRVVDPSQSLIPSATVTIIHQETGSQVVARSNEAGNYVVHELPFGHYQIYAEAPGFKKYLRKDVTLDISQTLTLDITLEIGQMDQSVEVTAELPTLERDTTELGTVVDQKQVEDLPLSVSGNMRNPESFVFLAPGVTGDTTNTQIDGSQSRSKEVLVDGASATSPESGGLMFTYPPVASVGEFKLISNTFSAEYGRTGGGFEVFTTKSGANQYHGGAWEFLRNDKLDARGFIAQKTPVNRQNEFGVSIGGPVRLPRYNGKNRTFFYAVYNGFRYAAGATNDLATVPSLKYRTGDFSGYTKSGKAASIYDPASTRLDASGGLTRDAFAGNMIPLSRMSKVSQNLLQLIPVPNAALPNGNYYKVGAQVFDRDVYTLKGDHAFSDRNHLSVFFYNNSETNIAPEGFAGAASPALIQNRPSRWVRLNHDFQFSPTTLNNFRAGYTRDPQEWARVSADQGYFQKLGLTGVGAPGDVIPRIKFGDTYSNWADEVKNKGHQVNNTLQLGDTVSHYRGNHSLKVGIDTRWAQTNGADTYNEQGTFSFNSNETALPTAAGRSASGNSFASFLLGSVDSANYNGLVVVPGNRYRYFAAFVQDDWKLTRHLTINLGLRWDLFAPRQEAHDNFSSFEPNIVNPAAGGRLGGVAFLGSGPGRISGQGSFANTDYRAFGPRFGFAYALGEKTVVRGGYGLYYSAGNATTGQATSQTYTYGFNAAPSYASTDSGVTPAFNWDGGFPTNWPKPPFINPTVQNNSNVNMIGPADGRPPYFQNYQVSVQRMLAPQTVLEAAYVGVKGTHLSNNLMNLNQVSPVYLGLGSTLTQSITSSAAAAAGIASPYPGFTGSVAQALRPYPQFQTIVDPADPNGNSTYNAMQVKLTKRLSRGLTVLVTYTWSKSLSDNDTAISGGPSGQDFYNRRNEKSLSTNDIPQAANFAYTYELPFGRGRKLLNSGIGSKLAGGWQLTGIQQYQAGKPVQLTANNTLPIFNGVLRPNVISGVPMTLDPVDKLADPYFNRAAFVAPQGYQLGTASRAYNALRAQGLSNESFGLLRRMRIAEKATLTFRAEFFNAFNRVVFAAPQANVSSTGFGKVSTQSNNPRQGQVALRLDF